MPVRFYSAKITHLAPRKSYLVILRSNSHAHLTKSVTTLYVKFESMRTFSKSLVYPLDSHISGRHPNSHEKLTKFKIR